MEFTRQLSTTSSSTSRQSRRWHLRWSSVGIRTKILVPLILLMLVSLLSSSFGFLVSTNTTRNHLLDEQIAEDARRITAALALSERDVIESAKLLAADPELILALRADSANPGSDVVLDLDRRALQMRVRFRLDQVLILNAQGQVRVNIVAQSYLSQFSPEARERLLAQTDVSQAVLVRSESVWLLVGRAPSIDRDEAGNAEYLGTVYTFLNISETLQRIRRDLDLAAEVQLAPIAPDVGQFTVAAAPISRDGYRVQTLPLMLGGSEVAVDLRRNERDINAIVASGLQVMLISNGLTLMLLLGIGAWLAQGFTRPILKLARVAQAVADGDLSRRSGLNQADEIGQLGRAFDQATVTIADLLDQRARAAGELHAILQSIADGVLAVDADERILICNPVAATLLEQTPGLLIGRPLSALTAVDDPILVAGLEQVVAQIRSELIDPVAAPTEERVALGSRIVRLQSAPIQISGALRIGAVVVLQDITRAVEADRAKNDFIATASHEMRTPLTSLKGFIDLFSLMSHDNLSADQRHFLTAIQRQTDNLILLVNDLLEVARFDQGTLRAQRRWVAPAGAIEEAVTGLYGLMRQRQVVVSTDLAPDLPLIWIDGLHLRRILNNLLTNAVKYVRTGGLVRVRAYQLSDLARLPGPVGDQAWRHQDARSVVIEIEDNGVGIRAEDQARIFTRFFRSENPLSVEAGGTGLGLVITRALVQFHEGQIGFRSVEGQGSCFWVRLPAPTVEPLQQIETAPPVVSSQVH